MLLLPPSGAQTDIIKWLRTHLKPFSLAATLVFGPQRVAVVISDNKLAVTKLFEQLFAFSKLSRIEHCRHQKLLSKEFVC